MTCTCAKDVLAKLKERIEQDIGVPVEAEFKNLNVVIQGNSLAQVFTMDLVATADLKGWKRPKHIPISGNYCPFCGKPSKEPVEPQV